MTRTTPPTPPTNPYPRLHHDEDMEVDLNGEPIERLPYDTLAYVDVALDPGAANAFRIGVNTPAVHCRRSSTGQDCDAALYDSSEPTER